jgi:thioredoxin-related protein
MIRSILVLMLFFTANCLLLAQRNKDAKPVERVERTKSEGSKQSSRPSTSARTSSQTSTTDRSTNAGSRTSTSRPSQTATDRTTTETSRTSSRGNTGNSGQKAQTLRTTDSKNAASIAPVVGAGSGAAVAEEKVIKINWMTLEQAIEKSKTEKKKIFVDVYTDWCGWCKRMDETTFTDASVVEYMNANFYAVKFNAEQQQDIVFKNKTYHFKKVGTRGYHELAAEWLNNRMSYPTVVFINEDLELIQPLPNYVEAARFETIITYFGTNSYKKTPWETYEKNFVTNRN